VTTCIALGAVDEGSSTTPVYTNSTPMQ
jgi:hypothetical protein